MKHFVPTEILVVIYGTPGKGDNEAIMRNVKVTEKRKTRMKVAENPIHVV